MCMTCLCVLFLVSEDEKKEKLKDVLVCRVETCLKVWSLLLELEQSSSENQQNV